MDQHRHGRSWQPVIFPRAPTPRRHPGLQIRGLSPYEFAPMPGVHEPLELPAMKMVLFAGLSGASAQGQR